MQRKTGMGDDSQAPSMNFLENKVYYHACVLFIGSTCDEGCGGKGKKGEEEREAWMVFKAEY